MHISYGFWGALLGIATYGARQESKYEAGQALATQLILAAGNDDLQRFYQVLSPYMGALQAGADADVWSSARVCAQEMQAYKDGRLSAAPQVQRFREWCVSIS
jgi:hypothetical protein